MTDESTVLGMLLYDKENYHRALAAGLKTGHFASPKATELYAALFKLDAEGLTFEVPNLIGRTSLSAADLLTLIENAPKAQNVEHYVTRVKNVAWIKQTTRELGELSAELLAIAKKPGDVDIIKARIATMLTTILNENVTKPILDPSELAEKLTVEMEARVLSFRDGKLNGIPTGIPKLDQHIYGWKPGRLHILGARTGVGKTTLAINFAWHVAQSATIAGKSVLFFTNEMDDSEIGEKFISLAGGINAGKLEHGDLSSDEMDRYAEAVRRIYQSGLRISDNTRMSFERLVSEIRRMARIGNCDFAIVDYLQQYRLEGGKHHLRNNRHLEITEMTLQLKMLAKELKIPILCLAQLNRESTKTDRAPTKADLKDSGSIEQDADVILLLYRNEEGGMWLKIDKSRKGIEGKFLVRANLAENRFEQA